MAYAELKDARAVEALRENVVRDPESGDAWELLGLQAFAQSQVGAIIPFSALQSV